MCIRDRLGEHNLGAAFSPAEPGIDGEEDKHIGKAHNIVDDKRTAVIADELRAVGGHQAGNEAEEADGRIVGDQLYGCLLYTSRCV